MSLFIPPASGPLPPVPELAHEIFVRVPRRRVRASQGHDHPKRHVMEGLLAFLAARAAASAAARKAVAQGHAAPRANHAAPFAVPTPPRRGA